METILGISALLFMIAFMCRIAIKEYQKHIEIIDIQIQFYKRAIEILDSECDKTINLIPMFLNKDGVK